MRTIPWALIGLFLIAALIHTWSGPDIWLHMTLGREVLERGTFTPPEQTIISRAGFTNFYWLFQIIVYSIHRWTGIAGLTTFFAALWLGSAALWVRLARLELLPSLGLPVALVSAIVIQSRFEERPEIFSYFFLILFLTIFLRWNPGKGSLDWKQWLAFVTIQAAWCNMHGLFLLAPAIVGLRFVCLAFEERADAPTLTTALLRLASLGAVLFLASMISPHGWRTWKTVADQWNVLGALKGEVEEFAAPTGMLLKNPVVRIFWGYWGFTAIAAVTTFWLNRRKHLFSVGLAAVALYLSATTVKNVPLIVFLTAPLWNALASETIKLSALRLAFDRSNMPVRIGSSAICAGLLFWIFDGGYHQAFAGYSRTGFGISEAVFPLKFEKELKTSGFRGSIFNHPTDGNYLLFHHSRAKVFGDSFFSDVDVVREYYAGLFFPDAFFRLHRQNHFDAALINLQTGGALLTALLKDSAWRLAYSDLYRAFFIYSPSPHADEFALHDLSIYEGQDLSDKANGVNAITWISSLAEANQQPLLLEGLRDLTSAEFIPAPALAIALRYLIPNKDIELLKVVFQLKRRMLALTQAEADGVDALLRQVPPNALKQAQMP